MSLLLLFHPRVTGIVVTGRYDRGTPTPGDDHGTPTADLYTRSTAQPGVDHGTPVAGTYDPGTPTKG